MNKALAALRWSRILVSAEYLAEVRGRRRGFAIEAVFGLLKSVGTIDSERIAFHARGQSLRSLALGPNVVVPLEIIVTGADSDAATDWAGLLQTKLTGDAYPWRLHDGPFVEQRSPQVLLPAAPQLPDEICLWFETALPFQRAAGDPQTALRKRTVLEVMQRRGRKLFSHFPDFDFVEEDFELLSQHWRYDELKHVSVSQNRPSREDGAPLNIQYYNGCRGPLYLRGKLEKLIPWLRVFEEIHLGGWLKLNPLAHFKLRTEPCPAIDKELGDVEQLVTVAANTLRLNDTLPWITESQAPPDESRIAEELAAELAQGRYRPRPYEAFNIRKETGGVRRVERLHPRDLIAQQRLLQLLSDPVEATLSDSAMGFRRNRSREDAAQAIRGALREGYTYVAEADIEDFFPSIDHATLMSRLDAILPRADIATRAMLDGIMRAPFIEEERLCERKIGLAQGSPLSPLLANVYLDPFDRAFENVGARLVRYADDFVLLARGKREAEAALDTARTILEGLSLKLSDAKTGIRRADHGFHFLGETFDPRALEDPLTTILPQRKPVIVTEPYVALGSSGDAIEVRRAGSLLATWPLRRVSELIVFGRSSISTALLEKCARFKIPVSIALESGYQIATIAPDSRAFHDISHRHARWHHALSPTARLALAAELAIGKVTNYAALVKTRGESANNELLGWLEARAGSMRTAQDVAAIRGHEGAAARKVFGWLQTQFTVQTTDHFRSKRRERGAPDRLNSMLNFGYYLLFSRLNGLMRAHGLNPYLGLLHDGMDDYETLVADVQELFRAHVDRLVIRLVNRGQIRASDFQEAKPRLWLKRDAAQRYAHAFEEMLAEKIGHVVLRDALLAQVRALRAFVLQEGPLWLYRWHTPDKRGHQPTMQTDVDDEDAP